MFARVFDRENQRFYKSIIYCEINTGIYQRDVVVNPYLNCFELVNHWEKRGDLYTPLVDIIQDDHAQWVCYEKASLLKYKAYCKKRGEEIPLNCLHGYPDICEDFDFLNALLKNKTIPISETKVQIRQLPDTDIWTYIQTQDDANAFMQLFCSFHDATLEKLVYNESDSATSVTVAFNNSGWYGIVELCFEGVLAINIRPSTGCYDRYIYEGTLLIDNETVFWADDDLKTEDPAYNGSYIKALNLKWRKIG